jgi:phosphoglucosamine mutase
VARLFGTDGIRGAANAFPMTPETALAVGRALVVFCRETGGGERPQIVVGRDTRLSGTMLESALAAGVCSAGGDVITVGVLPTAGVAYAVGRLSAAAGVVISASHNPYQDNGIKIFAAGGRKLSDDEEDRLELLMSEQGAAEAPGRDAVGAVSDGIGVANDYVDFCVGCFAGESSAGLSIVLDCANGATFEVAPKVFSSLGARVSVINNQPNGTNINTQCGSEHTEGLCRAVKEAGADLGLAFDGDGDRVVAVDEKGNRLTGDQLIAICASMYKEYGWLDNDVVVTTIMSNMGLIQSLEKMAVRYVATQVGDRRVVEEMRRLGAVIGGEESGHIIIRRHHTTGDGIIAGLQVLGAMSARGGRPLSQLAEIMTVFPQKTINVDVRSKPPLEEVPGLADAIKEVEAAVNGQGRVLVRYSGTQAMCRVMVEGPDSEQISQLAMRLADVVCDAIGAV